MKASHISLTGLASEQAPAGRVWQRLEGLRRNWLRVKWPRGFGIQEAQTPQDNAFHQILMSVISFATRAKLLFLCSWPSLALIINPCPFDKNILKDHANTSSLPSLPSRILLHLKCTYTPFCIIAIAHSLWTLCEHGRIWQPLNAS